MSEEDCDQDQIISATASPPLDDSGRPICTITSGPNPFGPVGGALPGSCPEEISGPCAELPAAVACAVRVLDDDDPSPGPTVGCNLDC